MTDKQLIDGFLSGELDEAGLAQLESELERNPELLQLLCEERSLDNALRVLLGDETADQQVTVSVLGVVRGSSIDDLKTRLMEQVKKEDEKKKKAVERQRVATAKVPNAVPPTPANPIPVDEVRAAAAAQKPRRRSWGWGLAAGLAASMAVAYLAWQFLWPVLPGPENQGAFLLSSTKNVEVHRGDVVLSAHQDMLLEPGDRIYVSDGAAARMGFPAGTSRVDLKAGSTVLFVQGGRSKRLTLESGSIRAAVALQTQAPFTVETSITEMRIHQGEAICETAPASARVEVIKGTALLVRKSDGKSVRIGSEQYAVAALGVDFEAMGNDARDAMDKGPRIVAYIKELKGKVFLFDKALADRTPAVVGQPIRAHHGLVTEGKGSRALVEYHDETRLEVGANAVVRKFAGDEKTPKRVQLEGGSLVADVVKQPTGRPMKLVTAQAEVEVLGTRFELRHDGGATRLQVEEGAVRFTQAKSKKSVVVQSGFFAVAAPGRPFQPAEFTGGVQYVDIDPSGGNTTGDGTWIVEGRRVRQTHVSNKADGGPVSPVSNHLYKVNLDQGTLIEATVEVNRVTPNMGDRGSWGFGVVTKFGNRNVVLRTHQAAPGGSVFEFGGQNRMVPFEHGREGRYQLKLRIERPKKMPAVIRGKLWQGSREPDGWMIEDRQTLDGGMIEIGFQTIRCAADFSTFRVRLLKNNE